MNQTDQFKIDLKKDEHFGTSAPAIEYHYDAGNDFYRLWLDRDVFSYTCALWEDQKESLEQAQHNKIAFHCAQAGFSSGSRVLDVGCGWGGLLQYAVKSCGVDSAVGLTLSRKQAEWVRALNLPKVEVRLENWFDHSPVVPYDAITAIGVIEHGASTNLGPEQKIESYRNFFRRAHSWLKPGGCLSLQSVVQDNMRPQDLNEYFASSVLPETDLPTIADLAKASERLFEMIRLRNDRNDYERTCREWLRRLKENRDEAVKLVGAESVDRYEKWLQLSIFGFHLGTTGLVRITFRRISNPRP